jgi:hypothetical protein
LHYYNIFYETVQKGLFPVLDGIARMDFLAVSCPTPIKEATQEGTRLYLPITLSLIGDSLGFALFNTISNFQNVNGFLG